MKRFLLIAAFSLFPLSAIAQQGPEDPRINIYRQLLTQANDSIAALGAQLNAALAESAQLKAQIAKRKQEDEEEAKKHGAAPKEEPKPAPK